MFKFKDYDFDTKTFIANFYYEDKNGVEYNESIHFAKNRPYDSSLDEILDLALKLCFLLIGTSYYKAHPTKEVEVGMLLDEFTANFLNAVYNEGLSQFAFENKLKRSDLAKFPVHMPTCNSAVELPYEPGGIIALQSGGKDSILTATLLNEARKDWTALYIGSTTTHPAVIDDLDAPVHQILRLIDTEALNSAANFPDYKNGHVPVTYILMSLSLVQAILDRKSIIITSIGHEGEEPHSIIKDADAGDLAVNHQWSKTYAAEKLFAEYVHRYICKDIKVGSFLRKYSELKIAEIFADKCWKRYGRQFSSCNVANYRQKNNNAELTWCGDCAKCANSYLIFAPFIKPRELKAVFGGKDLFADPALADTFRGLLGIGKFEKPFECVGEINELRQAYSMRKRTYKKLPFDVPKAVDFDYNDTYESAF